MSELPQKMPKGDSLDGNGSQTAFASFAVLLGVADTGPHRPLMGTRVKIGKAAFSFSGPSVCLPSGYALYYLGDETSRNAASQFHLWLGLAAPRPLFWHIRSGRKATWH
jgi:hypothetical protein